MNTERLCPLCCQNKTRGYICTECASKEPAALYYDPTVQLTIRGVPIKEARCPNEAVSNGKAPPSSTYWTNYESPVKQEKLYRLEENVLSVHFPCHCMQFHEIKKEQAPYSGVICSCGHQSWVDWTVGVFHTGVYTDPTV